MCPRKGTMNENGSRIVGTDIREVKKGWDRRQRCCREGSYIPPSGWYTVDSTHWSRLRTRHLEVFRIPSWRSDLDNWEVIPFPQRWDSCLKGKVGPRHNELDEDGLLVNHEGPLGVPWIITDPEAMWADLVWIDEQTMQLITKPQYLVSNEDNWVSVVGKGIACGTLGNRDIKFWLIICGKRRDVAIFTRQFKQCPIWASTNCVGMVVNFIHGNLSWASFLRMAMSGACASCTGDHCIYSVCALSFSNTRKFSSSFFVTNSSNGNMFSSL